MREAFLWGQVAGPILGGCLVWGRSGPSMVFSRAVLSACVASLLVPAAWRGPSHVALRLLQGLCTVSRRADFIDVIFLDASQRELCEISRNIVKHGAHTNVKRGEIITTSSSFAGRNHACCSHAGYDVVQE